MHMDMPRICMDGGHIYMDVFILIYVRGIYGYTYTGVFIWISLYRYIYIDVYIYTYIYMFMYMDTLVWKTCHFICLDLECNSDCSKDLPTVSLKQQRKHWHSIMHV